ncbi:MAG: hypothetical protein ACTSRU_17555 [Candidatus Hodarchaeales archaeon]
MRKKFAVRMPSVEWYLEGNKQTDAIGEPVVDALKELSRKTELAVNFEIPHGEIVDSNLDRQINVYVWSSPFVDTPVMRNESLKIKGKVIKLNEGQSDCFDLKTCIKDLVQTYLKPINDDDGRVIGLVENNNIFIPFDIFHEVETMNNSAKEMIDVFIYIISEARKHIICDKKILEQRIADMPLLGYVKGIIENSAKMDEKRVNERESILKSIDSIHKNLVVEYRRLDEVNAYLSLKSITDNEKLLIDRNRNALTGLLKNGYKSIKWAGNTLKAMTEPIGIEFEDKEFKLGGYEITIGINNSIRITNKKNPKDGFDHPHVRSGMPCWGNLSKTATKFVSQFEFVPLLDMILSYLKSYNPKDAYHRLGYWSDNQCERCLEDEDCCQC